MNHDHDSPGAATLSGQIERITYFNAETGYTVAQVKVPDQRDPVTVVGSLIRPIPGEVLKMEGEWSLHPKFGEQFKVYHCETTVPPTIYGIRKYLGSGLIKGIGPEMAKRIVKRFGKETLDIISHHPQRLSEVEGIGAKRIDMIKSGWDAGKKIREVMIFLQSHGISTGYAARIFKQYGQASIHVVRENPYRLAEDIPGIGFTIADRIAEKLGFEKHSVFRVRAGVMYVLNRLMDEGHVYGPRGLLISKSGEILGVPRSLLEAALDYLKAEKKIIVEECEPDSDDSDDNGEAVYLAGLHIWETTIAARLTALESRSPEPLGADLVAVLEKVQRHLAITLAPQQIAAIQSALARNVLVITGGPGTGKTTIIDAIVRICNQVGLRVLLAAPTGRAAKRMNEATGYEAKTIHRLLEFSFQQGGFQRNEDRPLDCHYLVIDEASMIDTMLMYHLLLAVPMHATLILVGDAHQLPSVGAGNVLRDIISSECFAVVSLTEIFRQAQASRIIVNAHRINGGQFPDLSPVPGRKDFYFREREDPEEALEFVVDLVADHIPRLFGFDPITEIQVLSPMHKGVAGTMNLNRVLQEKLNRGMDAVRRGDSRLKTNDKVMQVKNNYDRDVFNGDMGMVYRIDPEAREVVIIFDGRPVVYPFSELDEVSLAYAISIHKSQGSEYPAVVIPLLTQHYVLLQRNLIYTAVTRGKELVVVVGSRKALGMAIRNDKTQKRFTRLHDRLRRYGRKLDRA